MSSALLVAVWAFPLPPPYKWAKYVYYNRFRRSLVDLGVANLAILFWRSKFSFKKNIRFYKALRFYEVLVYVFLLAFTGNPRQLSPLTFLLQVIRKRTCKFLLDLSFTREKKKTGKFITIFLLLPVKKIPGSLKSIITNTWMMKKLLFPILPLWLLKICFYPWPNLDPFILILTLSYFLFNPCRDLAVILALPLR